jgi:hypothetical protein
MTQPSNILMPEIVKGVHAGALEAIKEARRAGTNLVIWRDGSPVEISPEEAETMLKESGQSGAIPPAPPPTKAPR